MKDEEMAEEYAEDFVKDKYGGNRHCAEVQEEKLFLKIGFQDGLKAGRPRWHDLRKDKNDLPKEDCQVITVGKSPRRLLIKKVAYYLRSEKNFTIWNKEYENFTKLHNVVAWCEIPTFDKE